MMREHVSLHASRRWGPKQTLIFSWDVHPWGFGFAWVGVWVVQIPVFKSSFCDLERRGFQLEHRQSARIPYLSKVDEIGTEAKMDEIEAKVKMCTPVHGLYGCSIAEKSESPCNRVQYTLSLLPLKLVQFGFCTTNLVQFRFFGLNEGCRVDWRGFSFAGFSK